MPLITDNCRTCGQTYGWHLDNKPRHPFVGEDDLGPDGLGPRKEDRQRVGGQGKSGQTRVEVRNQPTDLALRIALIQKGLLSQAEIAAADALLREAIDNGNVIVVGGPGQRQRDAVGPRDNESTTPADAPLGHGGGTPRGLRSTDWPILTTGSSSGDEAEKHSSGAEDVVEDRYGLGDASPVSGDHPG